MNMQSFLGCTTFKTHNQKQISTDGVQLIGTVSATYDEIVASFGEPIREAGAEAADKVLVRWIIEFDDGMVMTIYDWKTGSPERLPLVRMWCIGGKSDANNSRIDTILSLRREITATEKSDQQDDFKHNVAEPVEQILQSVRVGFGESGVAMAMHTANMKRIENALIFFTGIIARMDPPVIDQKAMMLIAQSLQSDFSSASGLMAKALGIHDIPYERGRELMGFGNRIVEAERNGAIALMKKHQQEKGGN